MHWSCLHLVLVTKPHRQDFVLESGWPRLAALHWGKTSDFQRRYSKVILSQIPEGNTAICCMIIQHAESEGPNEELARLNRLLNAQCLIFFTF